MRKIKQSTAKNVMLLMVDSTDHVTGKTGLTLTVMASKDGGAFASITPTVTERNYGTYCLALTATHTNTLGDLALHVSSAGADPADLILLVEAGATDADVSSRSTFAGGAVASVSGAVGSVTGLNPALLDAAISTRMATFTYTAPDNATISTINGKLPALVGGRVDASVGAMAANVLTAAAVNASALNGKGDWNIGKSGYALTVAPPTAAAIRTEIDSNSTKLDVAISTRMATFTYTAPDNATIATINGKLPALVGGRVDAIIGAMAANVFTAAAIATGALNGKGDWNIGKTGYSVSAINAGVITPSVAPNLDAAISSRLADASYVLPDNAGINAIRLKTDGLPANPASASDLMYSDIRFINGHQIYGSGTDADPFREVP